MDVAERALKHTSRKRRNTREWKYLRERYLCFVFVFQKIHKKYSKKKERKECEV